MTSSGNLQPDNLSVTTTTGSMPYETPTPGIAMTTQHYERIQARIRNEIRGTASSSIWLACALASLGVAAALWISALSTNPNASSRGKMEVAAWACVALTVVFALVHWKFWEDSSKRAEDVINEMDTYNYRRSD